MSARDASPRPAEFLPSMLAPNPVLMAAPRPDRTVSLLAACAVYCALGASLGLGMRQIATHGPAVDLGKGHEFVFDPVEPVTTPELPPPVVAGPPAPAGLKAVQVPVDSNVMPVVVSNHLPTEDHGAEVAARPEGPVGPAVIGVLPQPAGPAVVVPRHEDAVVLEASQIRILHQVQPVYPPLARLARKEGPVELRLTIDEEGVPTDVQVLSGPHPLLVAEAVRVARLWRFQPATVGGRAVTATFRLTVGFRLER